MPKSPKKAWMFEEPKAAKSIMPEALKAEVEAKAQALVDAWRETLLRPPPENPKYNYLSDLWTRWYRNSFYFGGTYTVVGENALAPSFESKFARMEYVGGRNFNLSYMRHTEKWHEVFRDIPLEEALERIRTEPYMLPL